MSTWTAIAVRHQTEGRAEDDIRRQGCASFKPVQTQTRRVRGKERTRTRLMLPGYIFASVEGREALAEVISHMRDRPRGIVGTVSEAQLQPLRDAYGEEPAAPVFKVARGQIVPVHSGPFAGFSVTVRSVRGNRVIGAIGQFQAEISIDHLRPNGTG